MDNLPHLNLLIEAFRHLPGVGQKSAERMAYSVLKMNKDDVLAFSNALEKVTTSIHTCPICGQYTEDEKCNTCSDPTRDHSICVVVSDQKDVLSFSRIENFNGVFHILGGVLSASSGVSIHDLNVDSLFQRIEKEHIEEVIIATNPTIEGETTALYLARLLEKFPVKTTRLGYGLPMGGHLDYADALTLKKALAGRTNMKEEKE